MVFYSRVYCQARGVIIVISSLVNVQDLMIDCDPTPNFRVAKAICMLQTLFGIIPRLYGKGKNAKVYTSFNTCLTQIR